MEADWRISDFATGDGHWTYGTVGPPPPHAASARRAFRFGDFELDVQRYELRRKGRPLRVERQPMDLLILLVERRPELVTREQIVERLWGRDVFVDVDTGINTAVRKIRRALGAGRNGRRPLVETVPVLSQLGRHAEGWPFMDRACALEPMSPLPFAMASQVAFQARDFATARARARRAIVIDPEFWVGYMMLGQACEQLDEVDVALDALATATRLSDGNSKPVGLRGYILATRGREPEAREVLAMLRDLSVMRYVPPFALALVHAGLGEHDRMLAALDRAYDVRDVHLAFLTVDPKWDRYRDDPGFLRCSIGARSIGRSMRFRTTPTHPHDVEDSR
jgi:hypothetical protein